MKQIGSLTVSMVSMENRPPFAMGTVDVGASNGKTCTFMEQSSLRAIAQKAPSDQYTTFHLSSIKISSTTQFGARKSHQLITGHKYYRFSVNFDKKNYTDNTTKCLYIQNLIKIAKKTTNVEREKYF